MSERQFVGDWEVLIAGNGDLKSLLESVERQCAVRTARGES